MSEQIVYSPIGIIHTPFKQGKGTPIQPTAGGGIKGKIEMFSQYEKGLKDLQGFSHIILLYHMHKAKEYRLLAKPFLSDTEKGIFAIRAPSRPNSIGLSIVRLQKIEQNMIYIQDLDIIDGTPLLDIKPWVGEFDRRENIRTGWLENNVDKLDHTRDDGRYEQENEKEPDN